MNADGSGQVNLTNSPSQEIHAAWSPDGSKISFSTDRDINQEVYVMNADGSGQVNLTNNGADNDLQSAWSPDGLKIAFNRILGGPNGEIYVMNADGSGQVNLTNNAADDGLPSWQALHPPRANPDSDGDGVPDSDETTGVMMNLPVRSARCKRTLGLVKTDPNNADTDADGLSDGAEVNGAVVNQRVTRAKAKPKKVTFTRYFSDPRVVDTDCDGLTDKAEVDGFRIKKRFCRSDPSNFNTDYAEVRDGAEIYLEKGHPQNPCKPD
jgi:TolB protein